MKKKIIVAICIIITVAFAVTFGVTLKRIIDCERNGGKADDTETESSSPSEKDPDRDDTSDDSAPSDLTSDEMSDVSDGGSDDTGPGSEDNTSKDSESDAKGDSTPAQGSGISVNSPPEGFFRETLFIGDSRTVGLRDYGGIEGAVFFADSGMSVYNVKSKSMNVAGIGNTNLQAIISGGKYKKIYVMLGINELGYPDMDKAVAEYGELIDMLKAAQPDASIIIQANLHVAEATSLTHQYFTNSNINTLNGRLSKFADNSQVFFIDVNPVFDDPNGNLDKKFTYNDDFHLYGEYYKTWADWIAAQVVTDNH